MSKIMKAIINDELRKDNTLLRTPNKEKLRNEAEVVIKIPADAMSKEDIDKVFEAANLLNSVGINFDCGFGCGCIDWEFDKHLKGAYVIKYHRFSNKLFYWKYKLIDLIKGRL